MDTTFTPCPPHRAFAPRSSVLPCPLSHALHSFHSYPAQALSRPPLLLHLVWNKTSRLVETNLPMRHSITTLGKMGISHSPKACYVGSEGSMASFSNPLPPPTEGQSEQASPTNCLRRPFFQAALTLLYSQACSFL